MLYFTYHETLVIRDQVAQHHQAIFVIVDAKLYIWCNSKIL